MKVLGLVLRGAHDTPGSSPTAGSRSGSGGGVAGISRLACAINVVS
jgi:hypothetical protein